MAEQITQIEEPTTTDHPTIHAAINAVMQEVGYVQKSKSGGLRYSFASESDLINALRPSLVAHGITLHNSGVTNLTLETYETSSGTVMNRAVGVFSFTFTHAPSGTSVTVSALGEGADVGDKACNKAMTGAYKYALRQTFVIETGDDPDYQASEGQQRARRNGNRAPVHWTQRTRPVQLFLARVEKLGLDHRDALDALGVDILTDFTGTMHEAREALDAFAAQQAQMVDVDDDPSDDDPAPPAPQNGGESDTPADTPDGNGADNRDPATLQKAAALKLSSPPRSWDTAAEKINGALGTDYTGDSLHEAVSRAVGKSNITLTMNWKRAVDLAAAA